MRERTPLAETLRRYMKGKKYSVQRLAKGSGVDHATLERWLSGQTKKPYGWSQVAKVAATLDLNKAQANTLLRSAGHRSLEDLLSLAASEEDRALLAHWTATIPNNLPARLTNFFGREEEIYRVANLLDKARIVTLTGPGGSGKTRLALEAAEAALGDFEDGVFFVGLAPIRDPTLVIPAISQALHAGESLGKSPIEALEAHLRDKQVLLLLDNFEQVVDAAPLVVGLLTAAPRVKALVTSRTWLHVSGEHELAVQPLATRTARSTFEELKASPAVKLFADRARAMNPHFALTTENAPLVAEICDRVDGLPLAIELAAARARRFTLPKMLERFPSRLDLGSDGPRDAPLRHRSLRCMISWSYDLLRPEEQKLFRRLAVFAGGCPEDAAVQVAILKGEEAVDVSATLDSLADANLLRRTPGVGDERRFAMLETIREYARELLEESGELDAIARAHSGYYLEMAETAGAEFDGPRRTYWLDRLELEHHNFRAALRWCADHSEVVRGMRLSTGLMILWQVYQNHVEGRRWLETFTALDCDVPPDLRARALLWQGLLLMRFSNDFVAAEPLISQALAWYRESGDLSGACQTVQAQGDIALKRGEISAARDRFMESLDMAEQAGDDYLAARACMRIALCAQEDGDFAAARHPWERSLAMARAAHAQARIAVALNGLGEVARSQRDLEGAKCYYQQALELAREIDSEWGIAMSLHNLAYVASYAGQHERAIELFSESLSLHAKRQMMQGIGECLAGLAYTSASLWHMERAARLCGAAEAVLGSTGARLELLERIDYEQTLGRLRDMLPVEELGELLAEGRAMSPEQAVEFATKG